MSSKKSLIELGLDLLSGQAFDFVGFDSYRSVFSLIGIDVSQPFGIKALKSVFSEPSDTSEKYYSPTILSSQRINYPAEEFSTNIKFKIPSEGNKLTLLEKYGSFVAVDVDGYARTSVYDLFKSAAAIHDCLDKGEKPNPFLLVSADFSGIQDTVYTISSKGALKTLRARSFMLELLTEHIVYEILQASCSERHANIYSGGGGFSLLLPNTGDNVKAFEAYRDVLNRWAYKEFSGKLFIALHALEFNEEKLGSEKAFKELRQNQADKLDGLKRRKFFNEFSFTNSNGKVDGLFVAQMPEQLTVQAECQITRRDDQQNEEMRDLENGKVMPKLNPDLSKTWVSESCFHQFKLGDKLIEGYPYICRSNVELLKNQQNYGYLRFPTKDSNIENIKYCWYYLSQNKKTEHFYWHINSWDGDSNPVLYANYVRKHGELSDLEQKTEIESIFAVEGRMPKGDDTATFEGLAASSCGVDLIGALRMDVDDMGNLFSNIGTLAELSAKSRMLNIFFKVYLNRICAGNLGDALTPTDIVGKKYDKNNDDRKAGRNVSVIYAGGDDLFILGAWDETTELAFDIQRCFTLFTGGLGISGGLTLHQPKFPLYQMARKSGEAEHVAKNEIGQKNKTGKKNRIALFYSNKILEIEKKQKIEAVNKDDDWLMLSVDWKQAKLVKKFVEFFFNYGEYTHNKFVLKALPNSFTYGLLDIIYEWHEKHYLSFPHLLWLLKKHDKELKNKNFENEDGLFYFKRNIVGNFSQVFPILHLPLTWIELLKRRG